MFCLFLQILGSHAEATCSALQQTAKRHSCEVLVHYTTQTHILSLTHSSTGLSLDQYHSPAGTCSALSHDSMMLAASSGLRPRGQICHSGVLCAPRPIRHPSLAWTPSHTSPVGINSLLDITCTADS